MLTGAEKHRHNKYLDKQKSPAEAGAKQQAIFNRLDDPLLHSAGLLPGSSQQGNHLEHPQDLEHGKSAMPSRHNNCFARLVVRTSGVLQQVCERKLLLQEPAHLGQLQNNFTTQNEIGFIPRM